MEFFEEAHIAKGVEPSKKESKSNEVMKKQLKQMLHGYKHSNNQLIKSSVDIKIECDDSSTLSGFTDLQLSDSSGADDTTRATIGSPDELNSILGERSTNSDEEKQSTSQGSIDISSMSGEINLDTDASCSLGSEEEDCCLENDDDDISFISGSLKSLTDVESSQEFDPDGVLASKIHERLMIKNENDNRVPKRKLGKVEDDPQKVKYKSDRGKNKDSVMPQDKKPLLLKEDKSLTKSSDSSEKTSNMKTPLISPPYISISATEMVQEKFDDILGGYKHSTIKKMSFQKDKLLLYDDSDIINSDKVMVIDEKNSEKDINNMIDTDTHLKNDIDKTQETEKITDSSQEVPAEDSVISIDDTLMSDGTPENVKMNELQESIQLIFNGNTCICVLRHPAKLFVHGKLKARAIGGTVEVFGHILTDEPQEIYAPYSNITINFTTVEGDSTHYGLFSKITTLGFNVGDAEKIVTSLGEYDGVLVLEPLRSVKMNFVEEYFSVANLFSKSSRQLEYCHREAKERLGCSIYLTKPQKVFEIPSSWKELNKYCFQEESKGILCGGKGVGKSTCLRYHVNRLLAAGPVLVIDLDIGQSEFTVAGNISATIVKEPLLGPNFTHQRTPERTLNLGMINSLDNMKRYLKSVVELLDFCANDPRLQSMRWLVNTMGLCNAVGLHYMTAIILHCQPTYLLQIDSKNPKKRFEMFLRPQLVAAHYDFYKNTRPLKYISCPESVDYVFIMSHHADSPIKNNNSLAPRDERYLNFLAYFGELLNIHRTSSLLAITPYEVQLQDLCVYMNVKIPEGTVLQVLNGKIVALCQHKPGSVIKKTYALADEPLLCHGHGLIRGIDFEMGILYVITPMPSDSLQMVDALLYADWVPELRGQESHLPAGVAVPYRMPTMHQQKQLMFTPRRRFNPIQLLKMSRGS